MENKNNVIEMPNKSNANAPALDLTFGEPPGV